MSTSNSRSSVGCPLRGALDFPVTRDERRAAYQNLASWAVNNSPRMF
jgi:hypothetical protein